MAPATITAGTAAAAKASATCGTPALCDAQAVISTIAVHETKNNLTSVRINSRMFLLLELRTALKLKDRLRSSAFKR